MALEAEHLRVVHVEPQLDASSGEGGPILSVIPAYREFNIVAANELRGVARYRIGPLIQYRNAKIVEDGGVNDEFACRSRKYNPAPWLLADLSRTRCLATSDASMITQRRSGYT